MPQLYPSRRPSNPVSVTLPPLRFRQCRAAKVGTACDCGAGPSRAISRGRTASLSRLSPVCEPPGLGAPHCEGDFAETAQALIGGQKLEHAVTVREAMSNLPEDVSLDDGPLPYPKKPGGWYSDFQKLPAALFSVVRCQSTRARIQPETWKKPIPPRSTPDRSCCQPWRRRSAWRRRFNVA
jgi:hypothetical protein